MERTKKTATIITPMSDEVYYQNKVLLRLLVRTRENFQDMRKQTDNRLGRKADGKKQKMYESHIPRSDRLMLEQIANEARKQEVFIAEKLLEILMRFPIYIEWLSTVKGIGPNHAAWIIAEIDIRKAENVSKITQFAGMNPGIVFGQKSIEKSEYTPDMGEIIGTLPPKRGGKKRYRVRTDTPVRGDKKTPGFLCPYNENLKTALMGRVANSFIKHESPYAISQYYDFHVPAHFRDPEAKDEKGRLHVEKKPFLAGKFGRYDLSDQMTTEPRKGGKLVSLPWKDTTEGHREKAAKRKMIRAFINDLYVNWRTLEGLSVRPPYEEEYLGKKHHGKTTNTFVVKSDIK